VSCGYQGYEFGASYPDSICMDGQLFDADHCDSNGDLYAPAEYIPCPVCHKKEAIDYWARQNYVGGASTRDARKSARLLVQDIRRNRGLSV